MIPKSGYRFSDQIMRNESLSYFKTVFSRKFSAAVERFRRQRIRHVCAAASGEKPLEKPRGGDGHCLVAVVKRAARDVDRARVADGFESAQRRDTAGGRRTDAPRQVGEVNHCACADDGEPCERRFADDSAIGGKVGDERVDFSGR